MVSRKLFVDTKILPSDVFTYRDDDFYNLVTQLAGPDETSLLKIQAIRTINAFLRTSNIFDILNIDSEEIKNIKKQTCFILKNNDYIVKSGIKGSMEYLRDLFAKKQDEISKNTNGKYWNISNVSFNTISTSNSSLQTITSTDTIIQQPTTSTTTDTIDHCSFIVKSIDEWCLKHGEEISIPNLKFTEGFDFNLTLSSSGDYAHIRCGCRASARLLKQGKGFQLSNYYRYLKGRTCSMLKAKQQQTNVNVNAHNNNIVPDETSSQQQRVTTENTLIVSSDSTTSTRSKRSLSFSNRDQKRKKSRKG